MTVSIRRQGAVGVILVDNPPVNALSQAVRQGILDSLHRLSKDENIGAIVIACEGRTFIAGADISEFGKADLEPFLPDLLRAVSLSDKPVVAALHGMVLGGGLETALSSHYRVALKGTRLGMPEVNLGLIPGSGGTQLLPRVVDLETALEMITGGRPVAIEQLAESGIVDLVVDDGLLAAAIEYAGSLLANHAGVRRLSEIQLENPPENIQLFEAWRQKMTKKRRGQDAPQRAIDAIEFAPQLPFDQAMDQARKLFLELRESAQSRAMRHAFFAERQAGRVAGLDPDVRAREVQKVAVIGAGTMGAGIAMCFSAAGLPVRLLELSEENLQRGLEVVASGFERNLRQGRMTQEQAQTCAGRVSGTCSYEDLHEVDLVIEAAFENIEVKRQIFNRLDEVCRPEAILATNTSYLDIDRIAAATKRPDRVVGMHFFSPANIMKLLEVVRATETSPRTMKTAMTVGKGIGKICVAVGLCYGFVGNRMYARYGSEANMLLLEGATPEQVDRAMVDWGMAMGPFAVADMSGIDIGYKARRERPDPPEDPLYFRPADLLVEAGRLGRKSGAGFYTYEPDSGDKQVDAAVVAMIREEARRLGVEQRDIDGAEIPQRLISTLSKEGEQILAEGIASRASDIDVIWLNGYGFPRWRGGPMHYADEIA